MPKSANLLVSLCVLYHLILFCVVNAQLSSGLADESALNLDQRRHYCLRNVTFYEDVAVNKTRRVEIPATGVFKMFKKSKVQVEQYIDMVKVPRTRLVNECCEGYAMADNKTCHPVCPSGCPENAYCRSPNMCQCRRGYLVVKSAFMTNSYSCDPRCSSGCPYGGWCKSPEVCGCAKGYRPQAGTCVPICTGEDCEDEEATSSEPTLDESTDSTPTISDATEMYVDTSYSSDADQSSDEAGNTNNDEDDTDDGAFPSLTEEANCTLQPCIGNTICRLVGRCACAEGFIRHQPAPVNGTEVGPICAAVIERGEPLSDNNGGWVYAFFIVVGVAVMMGALTLLLIKLWRHQRGSLDVEGKNNMCCKFDKNSTSTDSGHVDMI